MQWAIDAAEEAGFPEILLVLGEAAPAILEQIDPGSAAIVINEHAIEGQSTSIVAATAAANPDRTGTLLMLGDQPGLSSDDLLRVLAAFDGRPDSIAMALWQGEARSPVIFGRDYDLELLGLTGDEGARPLVMRHRAKVRFAEFDRPVPLDVDTEEDYQRLLAGA